MTATRRRGSRPCAAIPGCEMTPTCPACGGRSAPRQAVDQGRARARRPVPVGDVPEQAAHESTSYNGQEDLWRLVRALPPKQRTAIALRYVFDAAHADIASVMGTSEDAARRNVHEGLKRLRTEYER